MSIYLLLSTSWFYFYNLINILDMFNDLISRFKNAHQVTTRSDPDIVRSFQLYVYRQFIA